MKHLRFYLTTLILITLIFCAALRLAKSFEIRHSTEPLSFGVSFSEKYAQELGLDWQTAYRDVIQNLGIHKVRLMSYWDRHEVRPNRYNFRDLDWMIGEAQRRHVTVSLAIGLRQPRWPECHRPGWVDSLSPEQANQELLEYVAVVVNRYKDSPALESWQLENEASNQLFGNCPKFNDHFYNQEFDLVKRIDPRHDLVTNVSNQIGVPFKGPVGERVGFSIYNHATPVVFGRPIQWSYWYVPSFWHGLRAGIAESLTGSRAFVHELQAEPWGKSATPLLSSDAQYRLMNPRQLQANVELAVNAGFRDVYLWGAEWWYWRKVTQNDPAMWNGAEAIFHQL